MVFNLPMQVELIIASVGACRFNRGGISHWLRALEGDRPEPAGLALSGTLTGRGSHLGDRQPSLLLPFAAELVHVPRGVAEHAELRHDGGGPQEVEKETLALATQPLALLAALAGTGSKHRGAGPQTFSSIGA